MQMILAMRLRVSNALLQNLLRLLDKLAMQIDRIGLDAPVGIVLAENKLGRLLVVFLHLAPVRLAFFGQLFGARAITIVVRFFGLFARRVRTSSRRDGILR